MCDYLESEAALSAFLENFENAALPKAVWTHAAHVAMAAAYSWSYSPEDALVRARRNISKLNESFGNRNTEDSGYHETLTVFWLQTVRALLSESSPPPDRLAFTRLAVARFGTDSSYYRRFYDFDVIGSRQARAVWVAPRKL